MHRSDAGAGARQASADVHQARIVACHDDLCARRDDVRHLVGEHRSRDLGILQRERPSEAAADVGIGQRHVVDAPDGGNEPRGGVAYACHPQGMARGVIRDPVREIGADVDHSEHVDEQFGKIVGLLGERFRVDRELRLALVSRHERRLMPERSRARARWGDDGVPLPVEHGGEGVDVVANKRHGLGIVTRVDVHLAAAALLFGEVDLVP